MKNILLIGAAGYVGLNLYRYLSKNFNIISVDKFKNETITPPLRVFIFFGLPDQSKGK